MKKALEIIWNNNSVYGFIDGEKTAKEIHEHYLKFFEWAVREQHLIYSGVYEEWQTMSMGNYFTLDEVYQYYCDKILKK